MKLKFREIGVVLKNDTIDGDQFNVLVYSPNGFWGEEKRHIRYLCEAGIMSYIYSEVEVKNEIEIDNRFSSCLRIVENLTEEELDFLAKVCDLIITYKEDDYFSKNSKLCLLSETDYLGRMAFIEKIMQCLEKNEKE